MKRVRANPLLVAAGVFLILMAPVWRFAVAPSLKVVATDPRTVPDFRAYTKQKGCELLLSKEEGGEYLFLIRRK